MNGQTQAKPLAGNGSRVDIGAEPHIDVAGHSLPLALRPVAERLERSRGMLALGDDWDGEGSPGYTESTWHRAAAIVVGTATAHHRSRGGLVPAPVITKGDEGSIDVQWRTSTRNILINVPAEQSEPISFYAHDREDEQRDSGGEIDAATDTGWLLGWLIA